MWLALLPSSNVSQTTVGGKRPAVQALPKMRDTVALAVDQLIWKGFRIFVRSKSD